VVIPRGWTAVDVTLQGRTIRLVNTHLERNGPDVQIAQAAELIAGPANTDLPVVLLGDLNSAAGAGGVPGESATPTYRNMLAAGFRDVWALTHASEAGFTCCQREDLSNPVPSLTERIDVVLTKGALTAATAQRVGVTTRERTPSGLWPSDHSGVWAAVRIG
jgi:endonuclease/exonuclease/phosphatase family metal-dependent hydrolase